MLSLDKYKRMKKKYFRSMLFLAIGTMIISCSKDESALNTSEKNKMASSDYIDDLPVVIPMETQYPNEPRDYGDGAPVLDLFGEEPSDPASPFTVIETPTKAYLNETCLFDFSKKEFRKGFSVVRNKNVNLGFFSNNNSPLVQVVKLPTNLPPVQGWDLPWGNIPMVQGSPKEVLFARTREVLTLKFTKPIIEFGVELTPNKRDYDCDVFVNVGKMEDDNASGHVSKSARTPGGANFYGIKATHSFTTITISWSRTTGTDPRAPEGYILANLRYKLAK
jgi:hypothetical protein